jgi:hypothetical protein
MPETLHGPTHDSTVVLDVGENTGALVLYTPASLLGAEIEISPAADPSARTHTAVRARVLPDRVLYAAVYPALEAGQHTLWDGDDPAGTVTVAGGSVTEIEWHALRHTHSHAHAHAHTHDAEEALR